MTRERPHPDDLVTLVYDKTDVLAEMLRRRGVPGTIHGCVDEDAVAAVIAEAHVVVSGPFPTRQLAKAERLQWIQSLWTGVDAWVDAPNPTGAPLTRMTGIFDRAMAEYVFAHLLARTQHLQYYRQTQRERRWAQTTRTTTLNRLTLGVAGAGQVGRRVASLAQAFGMTVRGLRRTDPGGEQGSPADPGFPVLPARRLDEFLSGLDVLVLAIPATAETIGLIGADQLALLAPGAVVVNVGRGGVIDEAVVVAALDSGRLGHAVLDTFSVEPLPTDSPLWTHPGVTVTPHMSGPGHPEDLADVVAQNIAVYLDGGIPEPVTDLARGY